MRSIEGRGGAARQAQSGPGARICAGRQIRLFRKIASSPRRRSSSIRLPRPPSSRASPNQESERRASFAAKGAFSQFSAYRVCRCRGFLDSRRRWLPQSCGVLWPVCSVHVLVLVVSAFAPVFLVFVFVFVCIRLWCRWCKENCSVFDFSSRGAISTLVNYVWMDLLRDKVDSQVLIMIFLRNKSIDFCFLSPTDTYWYNGG